MYEARNLDIEGMNSDWKVYRAYIKQCLLIISVNMGINVCSYVQATFIPCKVGPFRSEPVVYSISHMFHHVFEIPIEPVSGIYN